MVGRMMIVDPRAPTAAQLHVQQASDATSAGQPRAMTSVLKSMVDEQGRTLRVEIRQSDEMWNGTLMCQSSNRRWGDYKDTDTAQKYQRRLADITGITTADITGITTGNHMRGLVV